MISCILAFLIVTGISLSSFILASDNEEKELQLVHVIMRHGTRTPVSTYPNDPYINDSFAPVGWGQLTNAGKLLQYETGKFLRERYDKFLGSEYQPDEYYTQSTDVDRTKASVQLTNAGLWPPNDKQKWGSLDWQPIPVHSEPFGQDMLFLVGKACPQYDLELENVMKTEDIQKKLNEYKSLFDNLTEITGKHVNNFEDVQDIYNTLLSEETFNLTLPEWTKEYYSKMVYPTAFSYVLNAYNDKLNRLKGGVLLKKIINHWTSKIEEKITPAKRKAFLYGVHDYNIANFLSTIKVWDPQVPGYGVAILLEFSKKISTNQYGVEVYFRNSTSLPPYQLLIPGCEAFCPIDKLIELTKFVIPLDWEAECLWGDTNYTLPGGP